MLLKNLLFFGASIWVLQLQAIEAAISYSAFQSPDQAYLELYVSIAGSSIHFVPQKDSLSQAKAIIHLQFLQEDEVVLEDRFHISSPLSAIPTNFIALERYPLPVGHYDLHLKLSDVSDESNFQKYQAKLEMIFEQEALAQSDISLLADLKASEGNGMLVRNGLYMEPLPYRYYGPDAKKLFFYHEIYHTDQFIGEDFLLTYSIESIQNGESKTMLQAYKRQPPKDILPIYGQLDISLLASGDYQLAIEVRDRTQKLLSRKTTFFQRSNPGLWQKAEWLANFDPSNTFVNELNEDSLVYSLRALNPILPPTDMESVNWMLKEKDRPTQQAYLFAFWSKEGTTNPKQAYQDYMKVARAIDQQFRSGFRYGFETDRGYIYLKYGRPTEIEGREDEPSAPPYEIWTYDELAATHQNNVRFVFYNPSLAPGDYTLLHSTARGEIQQPQWQRILQGNAPNQLKGNDHLNGSEVIDNFHRSSRRIFGEN